MKPLAEPLDPNLIKSLLSHAVLAPSSHNTQPWRFEIGASKVFLLADRTRALSVNDPDDRELTISCGCALMNLRVAAAYEGLGVECDITPESTDTDVLAAVSFYRETPPQEDVADLFSSIEKRRTYRKGFQSRRIPPPVLDALTAAASKEGACLEIIDSQDSRKRCAQLVSEGDSIQWSNPRWRRELAAWMHSRGRGDGLTVPGIIAPVARLVVRAFDMGQGVGVRNRRLADESPVLAVLGTQSDQVVDWLVAGQALERVLLTAHAGGLQASYLNQPIQVASLRPQLRNLMRHNGYPQILLRLGFPAGDADPAPRRRLAEVID